MIGRAPILGLVLAGGLARRMGGGDKGLRALAGRSVLARVVDRLGPQVDRLVLNANGDPERFAAFGLPVLPDGVPGQPGPLAGILAGLDHAAAQGCAWMVSAPADAPFLPADLVTRLRAPGGPAVAASGGRSHPVVALWPVAMRQTIADALADGRHRVGALLAGAAVVDWADQPVDPFFNVNTPDDLAAAECLVRAAPSDPTPSPPHRAAG